MHLVLDLGVITADILCIIAAYFASTDLVELIDKHPGFYRITALIILVYGIFMMLTKTQMHVANEKKKISQNYFKTFVNGSCSIFLNVGLFYFGCYRNFGEK